MHTASCATRLRMWVNWEDRCRQGNCKSHHVDSDSSSGGNDRAESGMHGEWGKRASGFADKENYRAGLTRARYLVR
jgi:hypothetical protein